MKHHKCLNFYILLLSLLFSSALQAQDTTNLAVDTSKLTTIPTNPTPSPEQTFHLIDYDVTHKTIDGQGTLVFTHNNINGKGTINLSSQPVTLDFKNGTAHHPFEVDEKGQLILFDNGENNYDAYRLMHFSKNRDGSTRNKSIPLWMSILPPLIAILLALIFREVIISLFLGVWTGAFLAGGMRFDSLYYWIMSFFEVIQKYIVGALTDSGHVAVIVFSLLIGGMVAVISRNGGMAGVVQSLSKYATNATSTQFITWLLGLAIFFDDYANTLIVGKTMRSVTDKFRISREKLAYIVDSTAAPVSAVAFITTWIGAELGYIETGIKGLEGFDNDLSVYSIFISSLKYSFYPILTLLFILIIIFTKKDYGAMYHAEKRSRLTGHVSRRTTDLVMPEGPEEIDELHPVEGAPLRWFNAFIPIAAVILVTMFGLFSTGMDGAYGSMMEKDGTVLSHVANSTTGTAPTFTAPLTQSWSETWGKLSSFLPQEQQGFFSKMGYLVGKSDSYAALLWASLSGLILAILLSMSQRIMNINDSVETMFGGFKAMLPALVILALAWSLASVTDELFTADFLTSTLQNSISPYMVPIIIFILAALIAFSTGSSWSTMAILYPIAIPTTWAICMASNLDTAHSMEILFNVISIVLAASVLGDHCSPISDTTILSSLASDCNHIDHVRTQLPYALTVGAVSLVCGGLSTALGGGWLVSLGLIVVSLIILYAIVSSLGKQVEEKEGIDFD